MITLRDVCDGDAPFLFDVYSSTRQGELSLVPWTEDQKQAFLRMQSAAQTSSYAARYPDAKHQVICCDGIPVGRLYLDRQPHGISILDITIAPSARNAGIGSKVLNDILDEADRASAPVTIYVETFNPSLRLFERLGFRAVAEQGFHVQLVRPAAARP
jgi:ribosomal protein S18 acetylase RimI-like enzyme